MSDEINTEITESYAPPVARLLDYGKPTFGEVKNWSDYHELGFGPEHVAELVRMVGDEELRESLAETDEVWATTHAWRALGQLGEKAAAAVEPLLALLPDLIDEDDWALQDLPQVLAMLGPSTLPSLAAFLLDKAQDESARINVADALGFMGERYPESRPEVIATLSQQLEKPTSAKKDEEVNAFVINNLVKLEAVETAPIIEQIYATKNINESIIGDWEDTQIRLGLLEARLTPAPVYNSFPEVSLPSTRGDSFDAPAAPAPVKTQAQRKAIKAKRKMEKASRKKNRKRK